MGTSEERGVLFSIMMDLYFKIKVIEELAGYIVLGVTIAWALIVLFVLHK